MRESQQESTYFRKYAAAVNAARYRVSGIKVELDSGKKTFMLDKKSRAVIRITLLTRRKGALSDVNCNAV